ILLGLCVNTLMAQNPVTNTMQRRVMIRMVIEVKAEDNEDMDTEPFELQFRYIPPNRLQFEKDGEVFARIIGDQYYLMRESGTWMRVQKETFEEMQELPPIAQLTLKNSALNP